MAREVESRQGDSLRDSKDGGETVEMPSYGVEFFEYRRQHWLAGKALPPSSSKTTSTYVGPVPPPPTLSPNATPTSLSGPLLRLEELLGDEDSIGSLETWKAGVGTAWKYLDAGRSLNKPMPLTLAIKVLRCRWVMDGTWSTDPSTNRAAVAPPSPTRSSVPVAPSRMELPFTINNHGQKQLSPPKEWREPPVISDEEEAEAVNGADGEHKTVDTRNGFHS